VIAAVAVRPAQIPHARVELDTATAQPARLALDARKRLPIIGNQIEPLFAYREQHRQPSLRQR